MTKSQENICNIKKLYPDLIQIQRPGILGTVHDVYIVKTPTENVVCRFSSHEIAEHNKQISEILKSHGIRVPDISIYDMGSICCEVYPFINGKTFYERIHEGMPQQRIDFVYKQLVEFSYKIQSIYVPDIQPVKRIFLANMARKFFHVLNPGQSRVFCNTDLNSRNVILDENDNFYAVIDLDAFENEIFIYSLARLAVDARLFGYKQVILYYTDESLVDINKQVKFFGCLCSAYDKIRLSVKTFLANRDKIR